jgi:type II secretory pathway pseudopilin PulG
MAHAMLKYIIWCVKNARGGDSNSSIMQVRFKQAEKGSADNAFALAEVLIAFFIFGIVTSGMIYGYLEANRIAEWSSQSQAATSYALQGMERMRSAQWCAEEIPTTNGANTSDVMPMMVITNPPLASYLPSTLVPATGVNCFTTNEVDYLDVPTSGNLIPVTNYLTVTQIHTNPTLRQIVSQVSWTFTFTGAVYTYTIITLRAPDQYQ